MNKFEAHVNEKLNPQQQDELVKTGFIPKIRKTAARLPFARDVVAAYNCFCDQRTPMKIKAAIVIPLAYFVLPLDLIPDFILAFGYTDDIAAYASALNLFKAHISDAHYEQADEILGDFIGKT